MGKTKSIKKVKRPEPKEKSLVRDLKKKLASVKFKLKEKEILFNSIVEGTLAGYWIWYINENQMYISPHLKGMLGYADEELENSVETINKLMHPSDLPDTYALLGKHVESNGKIPFEIECRYKHKDSSIVWVICTGRIVQRDKEGKPTVMIGCHLNNTELKKSENIQKYAGELERKNLEMEQVAYVASHDLQEPLNTIRGFINLLDRKFVNSNDVETIQYLKYINLGATRMSNLIKGLLQYSRIGKETLMSKVDCNVIIADVMADLTQSIRQSGAKIEIGELPTVMGYEIELRILFQNLLSNALKFRGSDQPQIKVSCMEEGEYWKFHVADNGIGIEPPYREKIFKLYQRLHPKGEYEGNGLGLAECHKIVAELHNGKIWVEENNPKGSIFNFTIPLGI